MRDDIRRREAEAAPASVDPEEDPVIRLENEVSGLRSEVARLRSRLARLERGAGRGIFHPSDLAGTDMLAG